MILPRFPFFEFFAGAGMARLGLGAQDWECAFANEWCDKKAASYLARFGNGSPASCPELKICDVAQLVPRDLPGTPTLVWGSFPCQDLSLAGSGAGLNGTRSGTFKPFWSLLLQLIRENRAPKLIVLENVVGALTSHQGQDFTYLISEIAQAGYRVGALVIDAVHFVPQSRPRLFFVAVHSSVPIPSQLMLPDASGPWHTRGLRNAFARLPNALQDNWVWWRLPMPPGPIPPFSSLVEEDPTGVEWHTKEQTKKLLGLMAPSHLQKLKKAQQLQRKIVGAVYKRTRPNEDGEKVQRAEIRFDQIAGCLRTPAGGSSRQTIVVVDGPHVKSRLLSPREAARLMGVPEDYPLPSKYNDAYHLFGDGLVVPVVSWLNRHLLLPLAGASAASMSSAWPRKAKRFPLGTFPASPTT